MKRYFLSCPFCEKTHYVDMTDDEFYNYRNNPDNELIQDLLARLSPTEREQLISKICPDCQKQIFGDDEETK